MSHLDKIKGKIFPDFHSFEPLLYKWKNQNKTIVFTNGCFDILHRGHIEYLSVSAEKGDKLVIGLNTDDSVRLLKGDSRPLNNQDERALLLAALSFIDAVILFDEETPFNLISKILPDILVKGSDYKIEEIAGFDIVLGNGGKVETVNLIPGYSTSSLIKKLKESGDG